MEMILLIASVFSLNFELCFCTCAKAEYEIDGECCPMCAAGNHVRRHCTRYKMTMCVPCEDSTFIDAPNGFISCFSCTDCNPDKGLRVKTSCTRSSDTVCEPLDGYYCISENRRSCSLAAKHKECSRGQYIKHKGTAVKDTECAECTDGTYSNGYLHICQLHSKCEDLGLEEIQAGTSSTDTKCGNKSPALLIAGILLPVVLGAVAGVILFLKYKHKICAKSSNGDHHMVPCQETDDEHTTKDPVTTVQLDRAMKGDHHSMKVLL